MENERTILRINNWSKQAYQLLKNYLWTYVARLNKKPPALFTIIVRQ
jgi:hypothetical protein